jgi:hypothetical protein
MTMVSLRSRCLNSSLFPLVVAALTLRVLIPMGIMPVSVNGFSLTAAMCSTVPGKTQTLKVPSGQGAPAPEFHCEFCFIPTFAGPAMMPQTVAATQFESIVVPVTSTATFVVAIDRAQSARAPPQVA